MTTLIQPSAGWQLINARELWQFRELLAFLAWRDVKVRYKQTLLGAAWAILQPALMMVVFTMFFGRMAKRPHRREVPYPLFRLCRPPCPGPSSPRRSAVRGTAWSVSERLITKIYFPRLAIPFASVGAAVVDFFLSPWGS